ncbi:hypothetical protein O3P69_005506 [Scylla paramamosain]|uniref:Uncharacterized protein n=1 Tax=Scylla paramamosain TaxID=85552 RepID=A0AAW0UAY4_SCYPA
MKLSPQRLGSQSLTHCCCSFWKSFAAYHHLANTPVAVSSRGDQLSGTRLAGNWRYRRRGFTQRTISSQHGSNHGWQ